MVDMGYLEKIVVGLYNVKEIDIFPEGTQWKDSVKHYKTLLKAEINNDVELIDECVDVLHDCILENFGKPKKIAAVPEASTTIVDVMYERHGVPNVRYRCEYQKYMDVAEFLKNEGMLKASEEVMSLSDPKIAKIKLHGNGSPLIGTIGKYDKIIIIDNVVSSGKSIIEALEIYNNSAKVYDESLELGENFFIDEAVVFIVNDPLAVEVLENAGVDLRYPLTSKSIIEILWDKQDDIIPERRQLLIDNYNILEKEVSAWDSF
ncbi:MAG: hypothetical protein KAI51_00025 [Candidatus Aenigmarchaeota archaeon]|nr:hypothetical protein [Candidatus Aenigmarchaeota archaeon]MCK5451803.1 hypothetical protein [Candidatus Aenigmarchaeota archaeon]